MPAGFVGLPKERRRISRAARRRAAGIHKRNVEVDMHELITWLREAPQSAISALSALLAAAVAFTVVIVTQSILGRRARYEFRMKKLEELYLTILEWQHDVDLSKRQADKILKRQLPLDDEAFREYSATICKPRLDRRVNMYILLYFPALKEVQAQLHENVRNHSRLLRLLDEGEDLKSSELQKAWLRIQISLITLRKQIEDNRTYFVGDNFLRPRYKQAADVAPHQPSQL